MGQGDALDGTAFNLLERDGRPGGNELKQVAHLGRGPVVHQPCERVVQLGPAAADSPLQQVRRDDILVLAAVGIAVPVR